MGGGEEGDCVFVFVWYFVCHVLFFCSRAFCLFLKFMLGATVVVDGVRATAEEGGHFYLYEMRFLLFLFFFPVVRLIFRFFIFVFPLGYHIHSSLSWFTVRYGRSMVPPSGLPPPFTHPFSIFLRALYF